MIARINRLLILFAAISGISPAIGGDASFCAPVAPTTLVNPVVLGDGNSGSVSNAQLQAALDTGGHILLELGPTPSTIVIDQTLVFSSETVLDGSGLVTLSGGDTTQIARIINPNPSPDAPMFTVTLQNINLDSGTTSGGRGGAIYKEHDFEFTHKVSLKLVNCGFTDNHAPLDGSTQDDGGGAFYGELLNRIDVGNCLFSGNQGSNGGAIYSLGSLTVNIVDSVFANNQAIGTGGNPGNGGNAGALGVDGGDRQVDVCRSRFLSNQSNAFGGAFFSVMYDQTSHTRFEDVEFDANEQIDNGQHTGAVYLQDGPWAMNRVTFTNNRARGFGGLFVAGNAPGSIVNGTFSGNEARTGLGGAMALTTSAPISIVNTSIANNVATAAFAAGIAIGSPNQLTLTNTLFANNTGGNIFVNWAMNNPAQFSGGGNLQWPEQRPPNGGSESPVTSDAQFADPLLPTMTTADGGFVETLTLDAASPAVDFGVLGGGVPDTDARGVARTGLPDAGSFEFDPDLLIFSDGFEAGQ